MQKGQAEDVLGAMNAQERAFEGEEDSEEEEEEEEKEEE